MGAYDDKRVIPCPLPDFPDAWIELPAVWLGIHAERRDEAVEQSREKKFRVTQHNFTVAMRLLENWGGIPGLDGSPDKWDFASLNLSLISWISDTVLEEFGGCFLSHKIYSRLSPNGLTTTAPVNPSGTLEAAG